MWFAFQRASESPLYGDTGPDLLLWSIYSELRCQGSKPWGKGIFPLMPH